MQPSDVREITPVEQGVKFGTASEICLYMQNIPNSPQKVAVMLCAFLSNIY